MIHGEAQALTKEQQTLFDKYTQELKLNNEVSNILVRDKQLSNFYEEALKQLQSPVSLANIVANDVAKELKEHKKLEIYPNPYS